MLEGFTETCACVTQFPPGILYRLRNISVSMAAARICAFPDTARGLPGFGLRLEGNADEAVVQIDVEIPLIGPHRVTRMVRRIAFVDNAEHPPEAIDQEVVAAAAADVLEQGFAHPLQHVVLARLERGLKALRRVVHDSDRIAPLLADAAVRIVT